MNKFITQNKYKFSILFFLFILISLPLAVIVALYRQNLLQNAQTVNVLSTPTPTPAPLVYYGVHVHGWVSSLSKLTAFETDAKKKASIVMWYQGWGLTDGTQNFETSWMNNVRNHGSIPMVTWEPWLYTNGINQPSYSLSKIINGSFDAYIKKWADDSKTWGHPYFLRFAEEMNGNWFPWSEQVNGNQTGQYAKAWKHVRTIFNNEGANNVTFVWSPNIEYNGNTSLSELYPGDQYVNWLGMDGYNWGGVSHLSYSPNSIITANTLATITGWQTFAQIFNKTYTDITALSSKPLMVAETASTESGGNKANWINDVYSTQIPTTFKRIKAVVWFNENKETDWRIESSTAATNAFSTVIQSSVYTTNNYSSLTKSPIATP